MKKRIISILLLVAMCFSMTVSAEDVAVEETPKLNFTDVKENTEEYEAILYLVEKEIMNGKSKNKFCPQDNLKREEFAKILTKALVLKETSSSPVYTDVPAGAWYASYARAAGASKLILGVTNDKFGVGKTLTRQDLAVILKRILDKNKVTLKADNTVIYADNNEISDYAKEAVMYISSNGIMKGKENNLWLPKQNVTRGDAAVAVYNVIHAERNYVNSLGRYGGEKQYYEPYDVSTTDRLAQSMPEQFDASKYPIQKLASIDFESDDFGRFKKHTGFTESVNVGEGLGFNGSKGMMLNITSTSTINARYRLVTEPGEVETGDFLVITCKMKIEGVTGSGLCRPMITVWDDESTWLTESDKPFYRADTDGWIDYQAIKMIPEKANDYDPPKFFTVGVSAYANKFESGKIYFDDIELGVVKLNPMNTVLMTPNYKGIIKGEDGVGDIALRAYIEDGAGFYDFKKFKYTARITDNDHNVLLETESDVVTDSMDVYFSSATLPMGGDYYLESILTNKETGEIVQEQEWMLHKKEKDFTTVVDIDKYGRVVHNGVPKLPISVYEGSSYERIPDMIERGCIDVVNYNGFGWFTTFNEDHQKMVKNLEDNDMSIVLVLGNTAMDSTSTEVTKRASTQIARRGLTEKKINNYKDLPNLFAYYNFDEQNGARYGAEFTWMRKVVENSDLDHPTLCAIDKPLENIPGIYAGTSDFLGYDPYPVTGFPDQKIGLVYDRLMAGKISNPNRPVYVILQGFLYEGRGDLRTPVEQEFRNMTFQALAADVCMLDMFNRAAIESHPDPTTPSHEVWNRYTRVFKEIQYLEPIIISVLPKPHYEVKGAGDWLKTFSRRHDGKSYLFTVSTDTEEQSAKVYLDGAKTIKGMYSGTVYEADDNGWFDITWEKYGTEVFEYEQADYKSSHAELTRFGISDCVIVDSEKEDSTIIVTGNKAEVEYNAAISDYAKFYINNEEKEPVGKIDLTGLTELTVKVVSEDGRFNTVKTYKIENR
jgi:hypothetical protein